MRKILALLTSIFLTTTPAWADGMSGGTGLTPINNNTVLGNTSGSSAIPSAVTFSTLTSDLSAFSTSSTAQGVVPGSNSVGATYYLNGAGSWTIPPSVSAFPNLAGMPSASQGVAVPTLPATGILSTLPSGNTVKATGTETLYACTGVDPKPKGIALGADGRMWVCYQNTDKIAAFTANGVETLYAAIGAHPEPQNICAGPDGRLWVTDANANEIDAFTTAGVEQTYPTTISSPAAGICAGPDGRIWATFPNANKIAAFTTAGVETDYNCTGTVPIGIAAGPDGRMWVAFSGSPAKIGAFTTAGVETDYSCTASSPNYICAGPDGRMWVSAFYDGGVAAFTTAGAETDYASSNSNVPVGICAGPDGRVWVCYSGTDKIGAWTTNGVETQYTTTGTTVPISIAAGPDGRMWITYHDADTVATQGMQTQSNDLALTGSASVVGMTTSGSVTPSTAGAYDLGSTTKPFRNMFLADTADTTYYQEITQTALTGNHTLTLPNADSNTIQGIADPSDSEFVQYIDAAGVQHRAAAGGGGGWPFFANSPNLVGQIQTTGGPGIAAAGAYLYVCNHDGNSVSVLRASDNTAVTSISVGSGPNNIVITPNRSTAYVSNSGANVSVIDLSSNTVTTTITIPNEPERLIVDSDGAFVYVANYANAKIYKIATASNTVVDTFTDVYSVDSLALSPDNTILYAGMNGSPGVEAILISDHSILGNANLSVQVQGIAIDPAGTYVYAASYGNGIYRMDTTHYSTTLLYVPYTPTNVVVNAAGTYAYAASHNDPYIYTIELSNFKVSSVTTTLGNSYWNFGLYVDPTANYLYLGGSPTQIFAI